jgi:hypothetical protein
MPAATNSNLAALALEFQSSQLLVYVGADNELYDLFWQNGKWSQYNLMQAVHNNTGVTVPYPKPGVGGARGGSPIAGFSFEASDAAFVLYIDVNNHIQELQFDVDVKLITGLPSLTGSTAPRADSPLAAFAWEKQKSTHVICIGNDNHVRELYWRWPGSAPWQISDLTVNTGSMAPKPGSPLAGYAFENQGTEHVFYIAQDNSIRELYYSGDNWSSDNLSITSGAAPPVANSPLACYVCEYENTQHVVYFGNDGNAHELYWSNGWNHNNLTQSASAPQPAINSALAGYSYENEKTQHVIYVGNDGNIQELYWSEGAWNTNNLSSSAGSGATAPSAGTPLAGYAYENEGTEHVIYIDVNDRVHELYHSGGSWNSGEVSS